MFIRYYYFCFFAWIFIRLCFTLNNLVPVSVFASFGSSTQTTVSKPVLSFINDNIGNYDTQWIPFNVERRKPCVVRLDDENQYLMFTHKKTGMSVNGDVAYPVNVITMSRGFSNDVFGEEGMCIPQYTFESVGDYVKDVVSSTVVRDAVSVENPCVIQLPDGLWRMYFNAVFFDGHKYYTKIFKADTVDFVDWGLITEVTVFAGNQMRTDYYQPNVTVTVNGSSSLFEMYAVSKDHYVSSQNNISSITTIKRLTSSNGVDFVFSSSNEGSDDIYVDSDGVYNFYSPCLVKFDNAGSERKKLYFTLESARTSEDSAVTGIICSIEWDSVNNRWRTEPYNGLSRIIMEKSSVDFNSNIVSGLGRIFNGYVATTESYFNPCVIWDWFNGCRVLRMYYNTYDHPYAYSQEGGDIVEGINELVIKTDYLEEWNWSYVSFPNNVNITADGNGAVFESSLTAANYMARIIPTNPLISCMAQGKWIGYNNVANTDAILLPETNNEVDYSLKKYSPLNWIVENNLRDEFTAWLNANNKSSNDDNALLWLMETGNYPKYLWWSRKGPGIYRYVGYEAIKDSEWKGKTQE